MLLLELGGPETLDLPLLADPLTELRLGLVLGRGLLLERHGVARHFAKRELASSKGCLVAE